MKVSDFLIYYLMKFYGRKKKGGLLWGAPLRRAVFTVGMILTLNLFSLAEIVFFITTRKNLIDTKICQIAVLILALLVIQVVRYIYMTRNRYEILISSGEIFFNLSNATGYFVLISVTLFSAIIPFVIGTIIHNMV